MTYLSSIEIKNELVEMLKWFTNFCNTNGFSYSAVGGTLIGAIRHKGFIPWDDDIDLAVDRTTYDEIISKKNEINFPENYDLISVDDGSCEFPFIKLINKSIKVEQVNLSSRGGDYLWIDIFPFDSVPRNKADQALFYKNAHKKRLLLESAMFDISKCSKLKLASLVKTIVHPLLKIYGAERIGKELVKYCRTYENVATGLVGGVCWGYGLKETVPYEEFTKTETAVFENVEIQIMSCWDRYLRNVYGDYMILPPEDKRASHELIAWRA